jgi:hypothetical protein
MKSLNPLELAKTPKEIQPANEHYLQRLKLIFNFHPTGNDFATFVEGVLLWDESMADTAARYLKAHPQSRMVVLARMVHHMRRRHSGTRQPAAGRRPERCDDQRQRFRQLSRHCRLPVGDRRRY